VLLALALLAPSHARALPDPPGAILALFDSSFAATGDLLGGSALLLAAGVGAVGDVVQVVDANRVTRPLLGGFASGGVHRLALGVSNLGTGALEGLRAGDVERLPEPAEAYLETEWAAGRFWTFADGIGALWLSVGDLLAGPARFGLRLAGARGTAERVEASRDDAAVRWLGPPPLPPAAPGESDFTP
jgi:hypothetical protein